MNKKYNFEELITKFSEKSGYNKSKSEEILNNIIETVTEIICDGDDVRLKGLGSFKVVQKNKRMGRNPKTGDVVNIPEKMGVKFTLSKNIKERIEEIEI